MVASAITLRFLAAPTDVAFLGSTAVGGGRVLEWIDKAAYACAVGWSRSYCVTAYVGNVNFSRPIHSGQLVEVHARLIHTGRSSMHIQVAVSCADPQQGAFTPTTSCLVIFVAVDDSGRPAQVPPWSPTTQEAVRLSEEAVGKIAIRADIEAAMREQTYTADSTAPQATLRFLAAVTDVNWGGKTHGGTVMRWIDEAAYVCAAGWSGRTSIAVYSGGIRFYRPIVIGHVVEVQARLLYTGSTSMHVSVHVRSGDPRDLQLQRAESPGDVERAKSPGDVEGATSPGDSERSKSPGELELTTHCLSVFVALDDDRRPAAVRPWQPERDEDRRLRAHAEHLIELRSRMAPEQPVLRG